MKINDYVRTKNDGIKKITKIDDFYYENYEDDFGHFYREKVNKKLVHYTIKEGEDFFQGGSSLEKDIIKSSPNIIDLIEVGDYVNGLLVIEGSGKSGYVELYLHGYWINTGEDKLLSEVNIKSIVTKEQFESMEYKVGD